MPTSLSPSRKKKTKKKTFQCFCSRLDGWLLLRWPGLARLEWCFVAGCSFLSFKAKTHKFSKCFHCFFKLGIFSWPFALKCILHIPYSSQIECHTTMLGVFVLLLFLLFVSKLRRAFAVLLWNDIDVFVLLLFLLPFAAAGQLSCSSIIAFNYKVTQK